MPHSTLDSEIQEHGVFALFKGDTGSGKSVGALSFPKAYVFDHDYKMPNIAQKHFPGKEIFWDTFFDVFGVGDKLAELVQYYPHISKEDAQKNGFFAENECPYETIIGDTVTGLSYTALKTVDDVKGQNILTMLKNIKATRSGGKMIELRGYDYYNGEDSFLKYYIDTLKFLWARPGNPKHVIICCHIITSDQKGPPGSNVVTQTRRIVTAGNKIAAYIPAQFDEMWQFSIQPGDAFSSDSKAKHIVSFEAIGEDSAKTALKLPFAHLDFTDRPLFGLLSSYINLGKVESTAL